MHNADVQRSIEDCATELTRVKKLIDVTGATSEVASYLTKYSLIRACSAIEVAFKSIVADFCEQGSKQQVKHYLTRKVRDSSTNPSYDNICKLLKDFDKSWHEGFKKSISSCVDKDKLIESLRSLVDARNAFAHGGSTTVSFGDVNQYFEHAKELIEILDSVVI